ncbi:hypothetical protein AN641_03690 [Candidatus Epulonipiscioides gigas]|nr:hypothetical protein AN641_03690 [Epulopiscium sp. SCG-C07WGA-EpuloA2]
MEIFLDSGHRNSPYDFGATTDKHKESFYALEISKKIKTLLEEKNIKVHMSRNTEQDIITLTQRVNKANETNSNLYVSVHLNSAKNIATGTEVFYYSEKELATKISQNIATCLGLKNRGAKENKNFYVLKNTKMPAILIETCFINNQNDMQKLQKSIDIIAYGIADNILNYLIQSDIDIINNPSTTISKMVDWAITKKATPAFIDNAKTYWDKSISLGINPAIPYAQYGYETGYGHFKGQVKVEQHNPCGLKNRNGNGFATFINWKTGIQAHLEHMALYCGISGFPRSNSPDPKHFAYLAGKGKTIKTLSKSWANNIDYATRLIKLIQEMETSC